MKNTKQKFKYIRVNNAWTQKQVAAKLNCTLRYYQQLENGKKRPTLVDIEEFCLLFAIPITYFLDERVYDKAKSQLKTITQGVVKLTKNDHDQILQFAELLAAKYKPNRKVK